MKADVLLFPQLSNVIRFPELSDIDKQYIVLEKQQEEIREQSKLIVENKNGQYDNT